jgi:hypothetical protein
MELATVDLLGAREEALQTTQDTFVGIESFLELEGADRRRLLEFVPGLAFGNAGGPLRRPDGKRQTSEERKHCAALNAEHCHQCPPPLADQSPHGDTAGPTHSPLPGGNHSITASPV